MEQQFVDVRPVLTRHRNELLAFLEGIPTESWSLPTGAPAWSVKDVAAHLLDADLRWLTHARDGDRSGLVPETESNAAFVRSLDMRNQRWVDGATLLSPRLLTDLLRWSGEQLDQFLAGIDLFAPSSVRWAGTVPRWFDLAREFTERWVHGRQIREASGEPADATHDRDLELVIRTFVWALPSQYRGDARPGTVVRVAIQPIGVWDLVRVGDAWELQEEDGSLQSEPAATLALSGDAAWRLLTGARYPPHAVRVSGDTALGEPLLAVRAAIV